jgi:Lon protease-like protein
MAAAAGHDDDRTTLELPSSEFECPLCLRLLYDPVTTNTCGHTFCRACLAQGMENKRSCPMCREPMPAFNPLTHPTTMVLAHVLEKFAPRLYSLRRSEAEVERQQRRPRFGIFYSDVVYMPLPAGPGAGAGPIDERLQFGFHFFEHRYTVMASRALATHRQFVIATERHDVGTLARITRSSMAPDGRQLVFVACVRRVRLARAEEEEQGHGLMSAEVEDVEDVRDASDGPEVADLVRELAQRFAVLSEQEPGFGPLLEACRAAVGHDDSGGWAACRTLSAFADARSADVAQMLDECVRTTSRAQRLRLCVLLADRTIRRVRRRRVLAVLALLAVVLFGLWQHYGGSIARGSPSWSAPDLPVRPHATF